MSPPGGRGRARGLRPHPLVAPLVLGALGAAATAVVALVDPNEPGHYPACPFLAATGWSCPGCGSLRAVHALTQGEILTAVGLNPLTVLLILPGLLLGWGYALYRAVRPSDRPVPVPHPAWLYGLLAVVIAFWVLRNVTMLGPYLGP
ncbi:DUF2752 domain-containing protein [Allonocardiopsis opalescens]|uniref:Uncharacterized protein DUF2752 n=1 Tax=Allonocardiopsis opalescens TaxID=1144618 RepID=A0A2T0Q404_9ACTN|nr:DUF2752 domain-containing protein [Allonocardiopsis opalescens]PRX98527.1 uncharacterized protein DUF2752 [Allonocardiopsis opalescens]